jgi:hypothetical protein
MRFEKSAEGFFRHPSRQDEEQRQRQQMIETKTSGYHKHAPFRHHQYQHGSKRVRDRHVYVLDDLLKGQQLQCRKTILVIFTRMAQKAIIVPWTSIVDLPRFRREIELRVFKPVRLGRVAERSSVGNCCRNDYSARRRGNTTCCLQNRMNF